MRSSKHTLAMVLIIAKFFIPQIVDAQLYEDPSGNIGIGVPSPTYALEIKKGPVLVRHPSNNSKVLELTYCCGGGILYMDNYSNQRKVQIAADRATFFNGGNVGIGTTVPTAKLDIKGDFKLHHDSGDRMFSLTFQNGSAYFDMLNSSGASKIRLLADGDSYLAGGNVGIGTETPSQALDVVGHIRTSRHFRIASGNYGLYHETDGTSLIAQSENYMRFKTDRGVEFHNRSNVKQFTLYHNNSNAFGFIDRDGQWMLQFVRDNNINFRVNNSEKMRILNNGRVGIGTTTPTAKLDLKGDFMLHHDSGDRMFWLTFQNGSAYFDMSNSSGASKVRLLANGDSYLTGGNVGIGTTAPTQKLSVNGKINAEEIILEDVAGADFVFEEDYDLRTLEETEQFIKANKHLPEIPSAAEMAEEGLAIKEMNILLLQKVEELTLHLIRMEKENKQTVAELKKEIEGLKNVEDLTKE